MRRRFIGFWIEYFILQPARLEKGMTQAELAEKVGTNKGYISRVENNIKDVRISILQKIVEKGLGEHLELAIKSVICFLK